MKKLLPKFIFLAALASISQSSNSTPATYNYEGRITGISDSAVFGNASIGSFLSGSFSYDTAQLPTSTTGWWSASYSFNSLSATVTADIAPGVKLSNPLSTATVINGPAFPIAQNDSFILGSAPTDVNTVRNGGSTSSISLSFNPVGNTGPLNSTSLPGNLNLEGFPYSGGFVSMVTGPVPTSGNLYAIQRYTYPSFGFGSVTCYGCYSGGAAYIPFDPGNTDYQRYLSWLDQGNKPMYVDNLTFQFTSVVAAVPEPETYALLLAGLCVVGAAVKRNKARQA